MGQSIKTNRAFRRKHKLPPSVKEVVLTSGPGGVTASAKIGDETFLAKSDVRGNVKTSVLGTSWVVRLWRRLLSWLNSNEKGSAS